MQEPKATFQAFREWRQRAELDDETTQQAKLCERHINSVEFNLPVPDRSLLAGAVAELHKLEAMLAFPTL